MFSSKESNDLESLNLMSNWEFSPIPYRSLSLEFVVPQQCIVLFWEFCRKSFTLKTLNFLHDKAPPATKITSCFAEVNNVKTKYFPTQSGNHEQNRTKYLIAKCLYQLKRIKWGWKHICRVQPCAIKLFFRLNFRRIPVLLTNLGQTLEVYKRSSFITNLYYYLLNKIYFINPLKHSSPYQSFIFKNLVKNSDFM